MTCPRCGCEIEGTTAARELRLIKSEARAEASRVNGRKGGRKKQVKESIRERMKALFGKGRG